MAKDLPPELCDLLGYTMGNYALGYFSPPNFIEGTPDTLPPEVALGHEPGEMPLNDLALETREVSAG